MFTMIYFHCLPSFILINVLYDNCFPTVNYEYMREMFEITKCKYIVRIYTL